MAGRGGSWKKGWLEEGVAERRVAGRGGGWKRGWIEAGVG